MVDFPTGFFYSSLEMKITNWGDEKQSLVIILFCSRWSNSKSWVLTMTVLWLLRLSSFFPYFQVWVPSGTFGSCWHLLKYRSEGQTDFLSRTQMVIRYFLLEFDHTLIPRLLKTIHKRLYKIELRHITMRHSRWR